MSVSAHRCSPAAQRSAAQRLCDRQSAQADRSKHNTTRHEDNAHTPARSAPSNDRTARGGGQVQDRAEEGCERHTRGGREGTVSDDEGASDATPGHSARLDACCPTVPARHSGQRREAAKRDDRPASQRSNRTRTQHDTRSNKQESLSTCSAAMDRAERSALTENDEARSARFRLLQGASASPAISAKSCASNERLLRRCARSACNRSHVTGQLFASNDTSVCMRGQWSARLVRPARTEREASQRFFVEVRKAGVDECVAQ